jgi:4-amino-4-deoxy-L-arabinose transferase-like glycosyltransferase
MKNNDNRCGNGGRVPPIARNEGTACCPERFAQAKRVLNFLIHDEAFSPSLAHFQRRPAVCMTLLSAQHRWRYYAGILLLWAVIFGPGMFAPSMFDDADSSHADAGREILVRHDWVTLHENGIRYLEKAPLPYWALAASFRLFGVSEWPARLPQALGVLALLLLLIRIGEEFLSFEAGFWAAVVGVTSFGPYLFTRILIPDLLVGFWIGLSLYFFFKGWREEKPSLLSCWGLAAAVALNVLTKSLIGIVFPAAIIFLFLVLVRDLRHLLKMRLVSSTLVFLLVAAPWHIFAALHNPAQGESKGFLWFYFVNEQFLRYLGKRYPVDYGTVPLYLFWGLILVWLLPWSAFLPQALGSVHLRLMRTANMRRAPEAAMLLFFVWAAVILLFFSFSTRQEYYVAPALPACALLLGGWLARESESQYGGEAARKGRLSANALFAIGLLIAVATFTIALISHAAPPGTDLADLLSKNSDQTYVLSLGHFLDLTGSAMSLFRGPLFGTALAFLFGTGLNWLLRRRGQPRLANAALAVMMVAFIECAHIALGVFAPVLGSKPLAVAIERQFQPGDLIISDGEYAYTSSISFYTGKQLLILNGRVNGLWYGSLFPDSPPIFLDDTQFAQLWMGSRRVYFVAQSGDRRSYVEKLGPVYELAKAGGKFVFSNRPASFSP